MEEVRSNNNSVYLFHQEFPSIKRRIPMLSTNSYFLATVGGAPLEIVKHYVANQRKA